MIYEKLVDNSLSATLSSIEIYNKPDFKYREEVFTILIVNAWELLIKAKILKDANDTIGSLYVSDKNVPGGYKLNRNNTPLTIEINRAMNKLGHTLSPSVASNIQTLVEIRDTAVHFYNDPSIGFTIYTLGAASLQNYQKLITSWFGRSLLNYNFYILPLGFAYNFQKLSLIDLETKPEVISNLIKSVIATQQTVDQSDEFYFTCEITAQIIKKNQYTTNSADLSVSIDPEEKGNIMIERLIYPIDKYPLNFTALCQSIKKERPNAKQTEIHSIINRHKMKSKPEFALYNFRTKQQKNSYEQNGLLPSGLSPNYNIDAVRFIIGQLPTP